MPVTPPNELFFAPAVERIDAVHSRVNAIVSQRPEAQLLAEAHTVADRLARGENVGPLAGLLLAAKDLEDTISLPTRQKLGCTVLTSNRVATMVRSVAATMTR